MIGRHRWICVILGAVLIAALWSSYAQAQNNANVLHNFTGSTTDGGNPRGSLIRSGSILYGTTATGGLNNLGTIFKCDITVPSSPVFTVLYSFDGAAHGANPHGTLLLSGSTLYGTTWAGGASGLGTLFSIPTTGGAPTILHSFTGGADGANPNDAVIFGPDGVTLFGMTQGMEVSTDYGTIFSYNTTSSIYSVVHSFDLTHGAYPDGSFILSSGVLYGTTAGDGPTTSGTIFSYTPGTLTFTVIQTFAANTGVYPKGTLLISGSTLYGLTYGSGSYSLGTVFSISTAVNSVPADLHDFTALDGSYPCFGALIFSSDNSTLYGMDAGDTSGYTAGTIFSYNLNTSTFGLLSVFPGNSSANPSGGLVLSADGLTLYGLTYGDGTGGKGTIFSISTSSTASPVAGPTTVAAVATNTSSSSGSSCFIATAAYGSYLDPHVVSLREFRDTHLLTNAAGRAFVAFYYRHSPPVAEFISRHEGLRTAARWTLTPVVYSVDYPYAALAVMAVGFAAAAAGRRRRKGR